MSESRPRAEPFSGYRIAFAQAGRSFDFADLPSRFPAVSDLVAGRRPDLLAPREADALYDAVDRAGQRDSVAFPLRFTPVRYGRSRTRPFPALALTATEILHLVHEGLFAAHRCREAAIAATAVCG